MTQAAAVAPRADRQIARLQTNVTGAWRTMMEFYVEDTGRVRVSAGYLGNLAVPDLRMRIVDREGSVTDIWSPRGGWCPQLGVAR